MLLEWNSANLATTGDWGRVPSPWAAGSGCEGAAEMPLHWSDVNPGTVDESGCTLSLLVTESMYEGIDEMISQRSDASLDTANEGVQTQFSCATISGCEEIVDLRLERNDVIPELTLATESRYGGVVDKLSEWIGANRHTIDGIGPMEFPWTLGGAREGIAEMLFRQEDVNLDTADSGGRTPFPWVTENECARVGQLLEGPHDFIAKTGLQGESSEPFTAESPEIPEPPLKRIRMLRYPPPQPEPSQAQSAHSLPSAGGPPLVFRTSPL